MLFGDSLSVIIFLLFFANTDESFSQTPIQEGIVLNQNVLVLSAEKS